MNKEQNPQNSTEASNDGNTVLPAVFESGTDKKNKFHSELKALLAKYDAEIEIQEFDRDWGSDEKMVVNFSWDEDLSNRTGDGIVPQLIIGSWENGS
jgi:hypothetical protein